MSTFSLIIDIIQAGGAIATAVSVIILLSKFNTKLKVSGEMPIKNSRNYLISIYNNTAYDNEITSISFWKGNPVKLSSTPSLFYSPELSSLGLQTNKNTHNILLPKQSYIEIPISCSDIALNYECIGEAVGKLYDTIFVLIKDRRGNKYCINTRANIDMFRLGYKQR